MPREPSREPNGQTLWFGAELDPGRRPGLVPDRRGGSRPDAREDARGPRHPASSTPSSSGSPRTGRSNPASTPSPCSASCRPSTRPGATVCPRVWPTPRTAELLEGVCDVDLDGPRRRAAAGLRPRLRGGPVGHHGAGPPPGFPGRRPRLFTRKETSHMRQPIVAPNRRRVHARPTGCTWVQRQPSPALVPLLTLEGGSV